MKIKGIEEIRMQVINAAYQIELEKINMLYTQEYISRNNLKAVILKEAQDKFNKL